MKARAWFVVLAVAAGCGTKSEQGSAGAASGSAAPAARSATGSSAAGSASGSAAPAGGSPEAGSAGSSAAGSAGSAQPADPETQARVGKKTGIAADETPEVVTEDLIKAIADGSTDAGRLIDPAKGLVTYARVQTRGATAKAAPAQAQLCGDKATAAAVEMAKTIVDKGATYGGFHCWNTDLATKQYASCSYDVPSEGVGIGNLVFVPGEGGLHLALLLTTETGSTENQAAWDAGLAAVKTAACK